MQLSPRYVMVGKDRCCLGNGTDGWNGVGRCSACGERLGDMAWLRGLGFRLGKSVDVKVF